METKCLYENELNALAAAGATNDIPTLTKMLKNKFAFLTTEEAQNQVLIWRASRPQLLNEEKW